MTHNANHFLPRTAAARPLRAWFAAIARFIRRESRGLSPKPCLVQLIPALAFHGLHGQLAVASEAGQINAVAIAFQTHADRVDAAHANGNSPFDWQLHPDGDCVYLALVLTRGTGAMPQLAQHFNQQFPHWRNLPMLAHRRGKLVDETGLLERLAKG